MPFTDKYRPSSTEEIQGHTQAVQAVLGYVRDYHKQKKKGLLIYGSPGNGKTSLACAVAHQLGLELVEVNASDKRNRELLEQHVGGAMRQRSLFSEGKLILFDEIDGLSGRDDRGGIQAIVDLIKNSTYPVLLTAADPWDKKFSTLRKYVEMVELKTLPYTSVLAVMKKVAEAEGIMYEDEALKTLARRAGGDLRGALTDLETLGQDKLIDQKDLDDLGERHKTQSMFNMLMRILKGQDALQARKALDDVDEDVDEVFLWLDENVPREYKEGEDLQAAYDALATSDSFRGRIRRWQYWRFLVYVIDFMTAGVSSAKREKYPGFTRYQRGQRLLKYWRAGQANAKRDAIAKKVADKTHTSTKVARESTLLYLSAILKNDRAHPLKDYFELAADEVNWLAEKA